MPCPASSPRGPSSRRLELIEKLTLLIPPPRFHTLRLHGVLAPHAAWRSAVIPGRHDAVEDGPPAAVGSPRESASRWAALLRRVFAIDVFACPRCGGRRRLVGVGAARYDLSHRAPKLLPDLDQDLEPVVFDRIVEERRDRLVLGGAVLEGDARGAQEMGQVRDRRALTDVAGVEPGGEDEG